MSAEPKDPAGRDDQSRTPGAGPEPGRPDRTLIGILAALAVLVIVSLAVVFTRGEPAPLDAATPAGVVQRYAAAVLDGDETTAASYLTGPARHRCAAGERMGTQRLRVTLVGTTERGNSADVRVLITSTEGGGPFGSSEYQSEDVFDLVRTGDKWLINHAPWQLMVCTGPAVKP